MEPPISVTILKLLLRFQMTKQAFFSLLCLLLCTFTRRHLFIKALHRTSFRIFDNSLLRDVFPENYKNITILLYLSSCAVETVSVTTRVMEIQLCTTKIYSKISNAMEK